MVSTRIEYIYIENNFKSIIVKYDETNLKAKLVIEVGPFQALGHCVSPDKTNFNVPNKKLSNFRC